MKWNAIFIVLTAFALASIVAGQAQKVDDRALPSQLSENEVQAILKETNPRSHVEVSLKSADARLAKAIKSAEAHEYKAAVEDVDLYASLVIYADGYTRKLPDSQNKDRSNCLKKIEQAIFKQSRNLEAVMREVPLDLREPVEDKISHVKKIRLRALDDAIGGGKIINSSNQK